MHCRENNNLMDYRFLAPLEEHTVEIQVRTLRLDDYEALIALWIRAGLPYEPSGRDSRASVSAQMMRDPDLFLGAFQENRLVGAVIGTFDGRKGWINRLAVDPREGRRGIAQSLIEEIENALEDRGARVIAVLVEAGNASSLGLFQKCGYTTHRDILYLTKRDSNQV